MFELLAVGVMLLLLLTWGMTLAGLISPRLLGAEDLARNELVLSCGLVSFVLLTVLIWLAPESGLLLAALTSLGLLSGFAVLLGLLVPAWVSLEPVSATRRKVCLTYGAVCVSAFIGLIVALPTPPEAAAAHLQEGEIQEAVEALANAEDPSAPEVAAVRIDIIDEVIERATMALENDRVPDANRLLDLLPSHYRNERVASFERTLKWREGVARRFPSTPANLRAGPGTNYEVVGSVLPDSNLWVWLKEDWSIVHVDSSTSDTLGFIATKLLTETAVAESAEASADTAIEGWVFCDDVVVAIDASDGSSKNVLSGGQGAYELHSDRDWWDNAHLVGTLRAGAEVEVLRSETIEDVPGFAIQRCRIRSKGR